MKATQKESVEQDVEEEFYRMIKDDSELYLRILRYEVGPCLLFAASTPPLTRRSRLALTSWSLKL